MQIPVPKRLSNFFLASMGILVISLNTGGESKAATKVWKLDPDHCKAVFVVKHDGILDVTGFMSGMTGELNLDQDNLPGSSVNASLDVSTINSGNVMRDRHLKSDAFFDSINYPKISFRSSQLKLNADKTFSLLGDLEIKGIKRKVSLNCKGPFGPVKERNGRQRVAFSGTTSINRQDFNIKWNREEIPGVPMAANMVRLTLEMEFLQLAPAETKQYPIRH